jgi:predicted Fe-Mo cluster-binding NifX family protein
MKIAISSSGKDLDSQLDPRFGRCAYFLIVNAKDMSFDVFDNQSAGQSSGAGIQSAQFLADKRVTAVITGHVGPNAVRTLSAAGIEVFAQQQGTIKEVVEKFQKGNLKSTAQSTVESHFGSRGAAGFGNGRGMRLGPGGGRGLGRGYGIRRR